jgi:ribonucleotide reductase beta subunit family protein with ferritin-like domain
MFATDSVTDAERYTLFPIKSNETHLYQLYKQAVASFWTAEEIDFSKDEADWDKLSDNERYFVKHILAFFAGSDGIVQENLASRFQREVQSPVARLFYAFQNAMEGIHSETYSLLIDKYVKEKDEQLHLFRAIDTIPCIQKKAQWALKWIESNVHDYPTRLVAFACVEGIFFSGAFCAIYWVKKRGLLPGLTFSNELISRDEGLHTLFAVAMYSMMGQPLEESVIREIIQDAVSIEKEFICDALPCNLIGMNASLMSQYIEFVADRLAQQLGIPKIYHASNPFDFMEMISLEGKGNFFERRISSYSKPGVGKKEEDMVIKMDLEDF